MLNVSEMHLECVWDVFSNYFAMSVGYVWNNFRTSLQFYCYEFGVMLEYV